MSTLSPLSTPLNSLNVTRASDVRASIGAETDLKTSEDTDKVAKKFEALLIHNMLKAMRSTTLGDKPSNERAMYDDMFDQQLSKMLSESGGLGIASSISRQLNAQNGIEDNESQSPMTNVQQSIQALSNNPNTLALNGQLKSVEGNLSQYQAQMNRSALVNRLGETQNGQIHINSLKPIESSNPSSLAEHKKHFIETLMPDAKRSAARLGIQPDIIIAIAALETGWGKHVIKESNGNSSYNLFGIKAHKVSTPHTVHKTTEFIDNKPVTIDAAFRRYNNQASSVNDFAEFLLTNPRYENALKAHADNHSFLRELQSAGYATDPEYANKAINVLRQIEAIQESHSL